MRIVPKQCPPVWPEVTRCDIVAGSDQRPGNAGIDPTAVGEPWL